MQHKCQWQPGSALIFVLIISRVAFEYDILISENTSFLFWTFQKWTQEEPQILWKLMLQRSNISRTKTHVSSCKKYWKAYLILLQYNNFIFNQFKTVILHIPSKFSFLQGFWSSFSQIAPPCLSKAFQTIYWWNLLVTFNQYKRLFYKLILKNKPRYICTSFYL